MLLPVIYDELKDLARQHLSRERADHTLQTTALVHEAYLRLVPEQSADFASRHHFYSMASRVMRSLLVDHARRKKAEKRGGGRIRIALEAPQQDRAPLPAEILALHDALRRLTELDEGLGRIVELRFFGGLDMELVAEVLGRSKRTVERRWRAARIGLQNELSDDGRP